MKISKLLQIILGLSGFLRPGITGGDGGGALGFSAAGAALAGIESDPAPEGEEQEEQSSAPSAEHTEESDANHEADGEQEDQSSQEAGGTVTIEVDGKSVTLNLSDLPEMYKGNLRQKDYTQKTMETAESRKAADAETAKARTEREGYARQLNDFNIVQNSLMADEQKQLTQELWDSDPHEYMRIKFTVEKRQEQMAKAQGELTRLQGEYQQEMQADQQKYLQDQYAKLVEIFPDWKDQAKQAAHMTALDAFLTKQGFSQADARTIMDARVTVLADKAMKYDELMAKTQAAVGKVKAAPAKVERPGVQANVTDGRTQGMKKLGQTGSVKDAGALLAGML